MHYYLIINEGLNNGLINSQIIQPIKYNSLQSSVGLISLEKPGQRAFVTTGLNIKRFNIAIPYRLFLFNFLAFAMVPLLAFFYAVVLACITKPNDVFIGRSYFPALVLVYLKKLRGNNFKFDPRSLFVHESVTKRLLRENSILHNQWLRWEKRILKHSSSTFVVAEKQGDYYRKVVNKKIPIVNIPCFASSVELSDVVNFDLLPFKPGSIVLAYYGSLDDGWNNKVVYSQIFDQAIKKGYRICIISQNFLELQKDLRFNRSEIFIVNTDKDRNYNKYLQACDYGIIVMPKGSDWETRLGVKFVEYLSNGLGVLVGEYVGEAVRLSQKHFSSFTYIIQTGQELPNFRRLSLLDKELIKSDANKLFGLENFNAVLL